MNCGTDQSPPSQGKSRPFICPCGKSYLSYPALFTHIKQKHQGKAPGSVVRPKSQNKRGRPRKLQLGDTPVESNQRPQFKSFACRLLFDNQEQKQLGYLINQVQFAKQRFKASLDFVPPITPSHLALILPPSYQPIPEQSPSNPSHEIIRSSIREILVPLRSTNSWASPSELEQLISLNVPYLLSLEEQRHSSRRPLGASLFQMELRTSLLEFLDSLKHCLSRVQFRNLEILIGLLIYFFARQIQEEKEITTNNYAQFLNTFATKFISILSQMRPYNRVFSLRGTRPLRLLVLVHRWLSEEGLTEDIVQLKQQVREHEVFEPLIQ